MDWQELIDSTQGLMSAQECEELSRWAQVAPDGIALEVGHYTGLSTCVLLSSLPVDVALVTVDRRVWRPWSAEVFEKHVPRFVGERQLVVVVEESSVAISRIQDPIGFVFYDADHTSLDNERFWSAVKGKLADQCALVFDDADWEGQSTLGTLAMGDGFIRKESRELFRHVSAEGYPSLQAMLDAGKRHPDTFTLEVMTRG